MIDIRSYAKDLFISGRQSNLPLVKYYIYHLTEDAMDVADTSVTQMDDPSHNIGVEDSKVIGDVSNLEDSLKRLPKVPMPSP